jgi:GNAT superfamily N-acetyltransferase
VPTSTGKAVVWDRSDSDPVTGPVAPASLPVPPETDEGYVDVLGAASFDPDRTEPAVLRIRYVTVRRDRRGERLGSRLLAFVAATAAERGFDRVRIAVNNPFAYEAAARAGFAWTGAETGLAELVCEAPAGDGGDDALAGAGPEREPDPRPDPGSDSDSDPGQAPGTRRGRRRGPTPERYRAGLDAFRARAEGEPEASFLRERRGGDPPALVDPPSGAWPAREADPRSGGDAGIGRDRDDSTGEGSGDGSGRE